MASNLPPVAVLAGGLGTRIRVIAGTTPKILLLVEARPFIAHLLEYLVGQGIDKVVLCTGHGAAQVWDAAETHTPPGMTLIESRENVPLGTGGAIKNAIHQLGETFFVLNGDTYLEVSLPALLARHQKEQALLTMALVRSEAAAEKGSVRVAPDGRILDFREKVDAGTGLINGGVYITRATLFEGCERGEAASLERDLIPRALASGGTILGHLVENPFVDIGLPEDYLRVRDHLPKSDRWQ